MKILKRKNLNKKTIKIKITHIYSIIEMKHDLMNLLVDRILLSIESLEKC